MGPTLDELIEQGQQRQTKALYCGRDAFWEWHENCCEFLERSVKFPGGNEEAARYEERDGLAERGLSVGMMAISSMKPHRKTQASSLTHTSDLPRRTAVGRPENT